jgi:cholesterol oxidase
MSSDLQASYTTVIIGTGFGGSMTGLTLARAYAEHNKKSPDSRKSILMLERGTWWTTPTSTVQDKEVKTE